MIKYCAIERKCGFRPYFACKICFGKVVINDYGKENAK